MSDLETVRALVGAACASLERSRRRIDDLNVYPVPDGDTGTNLLLTARGVASALAESEGHTRDELAAEATRAALLSARGNSGVILSQLVRGAADALAGEEQITAGAIARAFRGASDAAYAALREPVEGTILTVSRELALAAEAQPDAEPPELFAALVVRGEEAVARTTEQLDVLRQAGVVDAGGAGLVELVRGMAAALNGEELPPAPMEDELPSEAIHQEQSRFRFCTAFVVEGDDLDKEELERGLDRLGDSLIVVGDRTALKAHVHTDDPDAALALAATAGVVERVEIADMRAQIDEREERLLAPTEPAARCAVVAVCAGEGNRRLFESLGAARIVEGGQTMNPPTAELLAAIEATNAEEVIVLPDNSNVILSAEQAADLAGPDGPRRAHTFAAGGPHRARGVLPRPLGRGKRRRDAAGTRRRRDRRGDGRLARRRAQRPQCPRGRVPRARRREGDRDRPVVPRRLPRRRRSASRGSA